MVIPSQNGETRNSPFRSRTNPSIHAGFLSVATVVLFLLCHPAPGIAQEASSPSRASTAARSAQLPIAKQPAPSAADAAEGAGAGDSARAGPGEAEKDSPESIRRRAEWFYTQRSSV